MATWDDVLESALALPEASEHFDGYAAVLVHLERISRRRLGELVAEAWAAVAPAKLVGQHLEREVD